MAAGRKQIIELSDTESEGKEIIAIPSDTESEEKEKVVGSKVPEPITSYREIYKWGSVRYFFGTYSEFSSSNS